MAFFHYSQNNSGGGFKYDEFNGITHHVVVEADDARMANYFAEKIGLYFNGCDNGRDCECCGDRWSEVWDNEATETPTVFRASVEEKLKYRWGNGQFKRGEIAVHFKDGTIRWFN